MVGNFQLDAVKFKQRKSIVDQFHPMVSFSLFSQ